MTTLWQGWSRSPGNGSAEAFSTLWWCKSDVQSYSKLWIVILSQARNIGPDSDMLGNESKLAAALGQSRDHNGEKARLCRALCCWVKMLARSGVLNALPSYGIFKLRWVYLDITPSSLKEYLYRHSNHSRESRGLEILRGQPPKASRLPIGW